MKPKASDRFQNIHLISMPWPLFNRPSIQLGSLKAYLNQSLKHTRVVTNHIYLNLATAIGYEVYREISKRTWLSECVYAAILHPQQYAAIEALFYKESRKNRLLSKLDFRALLKTTQQATDDTLGQVDWQKIGLVGLSICLCQLTASLYAARQIKSKSPETLIVAGGSTLSNPNCRLYLDVFRQLDALIVGEGELPLLQLLSNLQIHGSIEEVHNLPGVVTQHSPKNLKACFSQVPDLNNLPTPDFDDYFKTLKEFPQKKHFFATLPVESSRGCWWQGREQAQTAKGCAFCNLNLQWCGYRKKARIKVVADADALTDRHQTLSLAFMDNVLPPGSSNKLFPKLQQLNKDLKMFSEIRATTKPDDLAKMRAAGMHEVQVGIEAFSTSLLNKMNKGTTAIQNLAVMRHCEALGLRNVSNLMLYFPGSEVDEVNETLETIRWARIFRPLKPVGFWLGLGSPVWQDFKRYNIHSTGNHPHYGVLFPKKIIQEILFPIQAYRGDRLYQRKLWKPVEKKLRDWHRYYEDLHQYPQTDPILSFQDGKTFLIIRQRRKGNGPWQHRLTATSRKIYLFCQVTRTIKRLLNEFPAVKEDQLIPFLNMMVDKKLMFAEQGKYLSLAVPHNTVSESLAIERKVH
jgi:ribosomal peptide maturation radical SAM protein 1